MTDSAPDPISAALELALARGERGVQVAAYAGEEPVVDAWAGIADPETGRPVDGDTLFSCFSVAKGVVATAVHVQAERGLIDYDEPIATYWPEFGVHGKERATVKDALAHRAGVPQIPAEVTPERLGDWDWIVAQIAAQAPLHPPGEVNAYHPLTFGWILGEVVRRTDPQQRPFARFVREEICAPLGIEALWFGVPADRLDRVARLESGPARRDLPPERVAMRDRVVPPSLPLGPESFNRPEVLAECVPAAGLTANARSVARLFALLANGGELDGVRLLSEERVRSFTERRPDEVDQTNFAVMPVGAMGFWNGDPVAGSHPNLICSVGAGGSIAWADLDGRVAGAVCHNRMFGDFPAGEHPLAPLGGAVREVAGARAVAG